MLHENIKQENLILGEVFLRMSHFLRHDHLRSEDEKELRKGSGEHSRRGKSMEVLQWCMFHNLGTL